jgi:hypothetical protein
MKFLGQIKMEILNILRSRFLLSHMYTGYISQHSYSGPQFRFRINTNRLMAAEVLSVPCRCH